MSAVRDEDATVGAKHEIQVDGISESIVNVRTTQIVRL